MITKVVIQDIAKYTVLRLIQNEVTVSPLKLQKLLYYMQAWHMVYFKRENTLFDDEPEAWVNGPVYRKIYNEYKNIGLYNQIMLDNVGSGKDTLKKDIEELYEKLALTPEQWDFVESVFKHYGTMSHDRLVFLTHSQFPWNNARKGLAPFEYTDKKISLDDMYNYYSELQSKV